MNRLLPAALALALTACGGSAATPTASPAPTPEPTPVPSVSNKQWDRCLERAFERYADREGDPDVDYLLDIMDWDHGSAKALLRDLNADELARDSCLYLLRG